MKALPCQCNPPLLPSPPPSPTPPGRSPSPPPHGTPHRVEEGHVVRDHEHRLLPPGKVLRQPQHLPNNACACACACVRRASVRSRVVCAESALPPLPRAHSEAPLHPAGNAGASSTHQRLPQRNASQHPTPPAGKGAAPALFPASETSLPQYGTGNQRATLESSVMALHAGAGYSTHPYSGLGP